MQMHIYRLTNMTTNKTSGYYYGAPTGWIAEKVGINCEFKFFTDERGDAISIKTEGVGVVIPDSLLGQYDNTWDDFWKREY